MAEGTWDSVRIRRRLNFPPNVGGTGAAGLGTRLFRVGAAAFPGTACFPRRGFGGVFRDWAFVLGTAAPWSGRLGTRGSRRLEEFTNAECQGRPGKADNFGVDQTCVLFQLRRTVCLDNGNFREEPSDLSSAVGAEVPRDPDERGLAAHSGRPFPADRHDAGATGHSQQAVEFLWREPIGRHEDGFPCVPGRAGMPRPAPPPRPRECRMAAGRFRLGRDPAQWCERGDSNPHGLPHWNLNPARLPIPPLSPEVVGMHY